MFHSLYGDGNMRRPIGKHKDRVYFGQRDDFMVIPRRKRLTAVRFLHLLFGALPTVFINVAYRRHFYLGIFQ